MSTVTVNTAGINQLIGKVRSLESIDFTPLMLDWREILENDNEVGIMAGLDGFDQPFTPVTYRPVDVSRRRKDVDRRVLSNNNLTSSWYRELDGPPLAPRELESRSITNFRTAHEPDSFSPGYSGGWSALGSWEDFLSVDGEEILPFHTHGEGNLPVRNLQHVRPGSIVKARQVLTDFIRDILNLKS